MADVCWVLLKRHEVRTERETTPEAANEPGEILGVYLDRADLDGRVARIAVTNRQYPLRPVGENAWVIGPEEDEGFFGHRPVLLFAIPSDLRKEPRG